MMRRTIETKHKRTRRNVMSNERRNSRNFEIRTQCVKPNDSSKRDGKRNESPTNRNDYVEISKSCCGTMTSGYVRDSLENLAGSVGGSARHKRILTHEFSDRLQRPHGRSLLLYDNNRSSSLLLVLIHGSSLGLAAHYGASTATND